MKRTAATLFALILFFAAAPAQAGQSTKDKIRQLIELDGAATVADAVIDKQRPLVRQTFLAGHPGSSNKMADAYVDAFSAELTARRGQFLDLIVEIYAKTFTAAEVDGLLAFYTSPLGSKARAAAPSIIVHAQQAGAAWGMKYGVSVAAAAKAQLKAMGYGIK